MNKTIFLRAIYLAVLLWAVQPGCSDDDTNTDVDTDDGGVDTGSETNNYQVPGPGWESFGTACEVDADCSGYPLDEKRCIHNCLNVINVPNGYCTACCNEAGHDICAPGVDCVGEDGVYLVCLAHCLNDDDCRQDDGYECRPIYHIPDRFPGKYCLPVPELVEPDTDDESTLVCPWPWL